MAFFRNFDSRMDSDHNVNGNGKEEDSRELDLNFVEKDVHHLDAEQYGSGEDASRQQSDASGGNGRPGRRTAPSGTWGSNFWKDYQPVVPGEKGREEEAVAVFDEDSDGQKELQRGQADVPADEMLSDDYYEQDVEELSDSFHGKGVSHPSARLPPRPVSGKKSVAKSSKAATYDEYNEDEDSDDEDEEDEDDPDDVDFEPDFGETSKSTKNKQRLPVRRA